MATMVLTMQETLSNLNRNTILFIQYKLMKLKIYIQWINKLQSFFHRLKSLMVYWVKKFIRILS